MELDYIAVGDYLIPSLTLSDPPDAPPLGKYGMLHKAYLREWKPALYAQLLLSERPYPICREIDSAAAGEYAQGVEQDAGQERTGIETENSITISVTMIIGGSLRAPPTKLL